MCFLRPVIFNVMMILIAFLATGTANAKKITPSHVYQSVDRLVAELKLIHTANESKITLGNYVTTNRKPRHVIQKAREVFQRVQDLRVINGLPANPVPPFPIKEIAPQDVKGIVDKIIIELLPVKKYYVVDEEAKELPLPTGKTPSDVYMHLARAEHLLSSLDLPSIVPNNVYQLSISVINDLNLILKSKGKPTIENVTFVSKGKKPSDVYEAVQSLISKLQQVCKRDSGICPPGGIKLPPKPTSSISPAYVLDLLNNVLADVGSMKIKAGIPKVTAIPPLPSGKTPSNVYDAVNTAQTLVSKI